MCRSTVEQIIFIAFEDETDFWTSCDEYEIKNQKVIDFYTSMCEVTGVKLHDDKVATRRCQWINNKICIRIKRAHLHNNVVQ